MRFLRWISKFSMLYPWRHTCSPASVQSSSVHWKNLVFFSALKSERFFTAFGGRLCSWFNT